MTRHPVTSVQPRLPDPGVQLAYPHDTDSFYVEEIPLYTPSGEGEHLYLWIEKRDIDTPTLVRRLASHLGISDRDIGWAGRKDRRAVARQWLSLPNAAANGERDFGDENFTVLARGRHGNKLRLGHLRGNRFRLLLKGEASPEQLAPSMASLAAEGMPNYFGFQRFGKNQDNHLAGRFLLERGGRLKGRRNMFLLSAYQSALFNQVVLGRLGELNGVREGDLAWLHAKGAVFTVEAPDLDTARCATLEISPSGPLPGRKMSRPTGPAAELEDALLASSGWQESFAVALRGGRRPLRVPVGEPVLHQVTGGLELSFTLPSGSYASVLLAELGIRPSGPTSQRSDHASCED
ncbi:MAG: tRNA pseudouridine(13) synthase TruD [bacterium]|nr:tRNA pseudouridine(13) synthase TruD [bacterium]